MKIPMVLMAYRASPHSSTGYTPNRLFLGRENCLPIDLVLGRPKQQVEARSVDEFVQAQEKAIEAAFRLARGHLRVAAERRKKAYDIRVKEQAFKEGDWVYYYYPRRRVGKSAKWQKFYEGPYLVIRCIPPSNYVIQKSQRSKPMTIHGDKLKKYFGEPPRSWIEVATGNFLPAEEAPEEIVSRIGGCFVASWC